MESSVRYIQLPNAGQRPALCFRGSRSAYAVLNLGTIRTIEVSLKDYDKALPVKSTRGGDNYSPAAFKESLLRVAQNRMMTSRAKILLDRGDSIKPEEELPAEEVLPMPKDDEETELTPDTQEAEGNHVIAKPKVRKLPRKLIRKADRKEVSSLAPIADTILGRRPANGSAGPPRPADRPSRPGPIAPLPRKAAETARTPVKNESKSRSQGKTLVAVLAAELGIAQQPCRVKLRAAGLRAPYDEKSEPACRKALGLPAKKGK